MCNVTSRDLPKPYLHRLSSEETSADAAIVLLVTLVAARFTHFMLIVCGLCLRIACCLPADSLLPADGRCGFIAACWQVVSWTSTRQGKPASDHDFSQWPQWLGPQVELIQVSNAARSVCSC